MMNSIDLFASAGSFLKGLNKTEILASIAPVIVGEFLDIAIKHSQKSEYEKQFEELRKDIGIELAYAEPYYSGVISPDHPMVENYKAIKQRLEELSAVFKCFLERHRKKKKVKGLLLKKMLEVPINLLNIANNMITNLILSSDILKEKSEYNKDWAHAIKVAIGLA